MSATADDSIRSVLLLPSGALGDNVLQLRIAQAMRYALPEAEITWLGRDGWLSIAQRCTAIHEALGHDALQAHRLFEAAGQTDADLARFLGGFDVIVNGLAGPDGPVMDRLRRFARRAALWYEPKPQVCVAQHTCRQWLEQIVAQMTWVCSGAAMRLQQYSVSLAHPADALLAPRPEDLAAAAERLQAAHIDSTGGDGCFTLVHPGSGGLHKCYPIEKYLRLSRLLRQQNVPTVMVLGPAELDRWGERISQLVRQCTLMADPPLPVLVALAQLARAYVGNDSGPTHVAAATGAATIALFGPSDPGIWGPCGPKVTVLRSREHESGWDDLPVERIAELLVGR